MGGSPPRMVACLGLAWRRCTKRCLRRSVLRRTTAVVVEHGPTVFPPAESACRVDPLGGGQELSDRACLLASERSTIGVALRSVRDVARDVDD